MKNKKTYPPAVIDYSEALIKKLKEDSFFEMEDINENVFREVANELGLTKFLCNQEIIFDTKEFEKILQVSAIQSTVNNLIAGGIIDSIEDEDGKEIIWLTPLGREIAKEISGSGFFEKNKNE